MDYPDAFRAETLQLSMFLNFHSPLVSVIESLSRVSRLQKKIRRDDVLLREGALEQQEERPTYIDTR
jgi:hypothetical protein